MEKLRKRFERMRNAQSRRIHIKEVYGFANPKFRLSYGKEAKKQYLCQERNVNPHHCAVL